MRTVCLSVRHSGQGMAGPKVFVFSKTLQQSRVPDATVSENLQKTVTELKQMKGKDIWLWGGGELFRSMLEAKLVDEIEVAVIPVLLGDGVPLLPRTKTRVRLKLNEQRLFKKTGTLLLTYGVKYSQR